MEKTYPVDDVEIATFYLKSGNTITIPLCGFKKDEDGRNMSWNNVEGMAKMAYITIDSIEAVVVEPVVKKEEGSSETIPTTRKYNF